MWQNRKDNGFGVRYTQVEILSSCVTLGLHLLCGADTYITVLLRGLNLMMCVNT